MGRQAFLVIHGIGQQRPFDTLDQFSRGMIKQLELSDCGFSLSHRINERDGGDWYESFLRIHHQGGHSDIHEYYWAHHTEQQIKPVEVLDWLNRSLAGSKRLLSENRELAEKYNKDGGIYSFHTQALIRQLRWLYPIFSLVQILPQWRIFRPIFNFIAKWPSTILTNYISDIAIYTTTDEKSRHFTTRQKILNGAVAVLEDILQREEYDEVIVCGHSLGSVVAYDALNRINVKLNVNQELEPYIHKIKAFISFGSPLDKIAFFFREHIAEKQYIRRQIVDQLFSFRARQLRSIVEGHKISAPAEPKLDHIDWINYYSDKDPISDHISLSKVREEDNIHLANTGHIDYWHNDQFYDDIIHRFLLSKEDVEQQETG